MSEEPEILEVELGSPKEAGAEPADPGDGHSSGDDADEGNGDDESDQDDVSGPGPPPGPGPQENAAERLNRTIMERLRAMLEDSGMRKDF